ncbi:MAG: Gfo/Idh/MocA family oxidoreductase [Bacteroidota bacterium]
MISETKKFNWGILGAGKIAGKFATDLALLPNANLYAVGSRSFEKAKDFANQYQFEKAYGSYEELLDDPQLDVVYIATPNSEHFRHSLLALEKGVAVLCEKPLALNSKEVNLMIEKAKETNTFLMEALWTLFLPHMLKVQELIAERVIGEVQSVRSDFGFLAKFDPQHRLFNPALGGGALLDIGIYPLLLAQSILGVPDRISATAILGETKVDEDINIALTYGNKKIAHLQATLRSITPLDTHIYGTKGYIYLPNRWHKPVPYIRVHDYGSSQDIRYEMPTDVLGYKFEARAVMECLDAGLTENPIASWQFSSDLMKTMDTIRKQVGVGYAVD